MITSAMIICLGLNIYWEGGSSNEPLANQYAIGFVTLNRAWKADESLCKTVFKRGQFSWTRNALDKQHHLKRSYWPPNNKAWRQCKEIARWILHHHEADFTMGSEYFYADYIPKPKWANNLVFTGRYGRHNFYKEPDG